MQNPYMQQQGGGQQFPYPVDRPLEGTLNHQLPQGNDVFPELQVPPELVDYAPLVVSQFRAALQQGIQKGPLHTLAYNIAADGYFRNNNTPNFAGHCQGALDATNYLVNVEGHQPQEAVRRAVVYIYNGFLATVLSHYPALASGIDQRLPDSLKQAYDDYQGLIAAITENGLTNGRSYQGPVGGGNPYAQQRGGGNPYAQQGGNYTVGDPPRGFQQPTAPGPIQTGAGPGATPYPNQPHRAPAPHPQGQATASLQRQSSGQTNPVGRASLRSHGGAEISSFQTAPDGPVTKTNNKGFEPLTSKGADMTTPTPEPATPTADECAVTRLQDIVINTRYSVSEDSSRPLDKLVYPGEVVVIPAHLSPAKPADTLAVDPREQIAFHVFWPDNLVETLYVDIAEQPHMEYLVHEIRRELLPSSRLNDGKVVPNTRGFEKLATREPKVKKSSIEEEPARIAVTEPYSVDGMFTASTAMENEEEAYRQLLEQYPALRDEKPESLAYEYRSARLHPLSLPSEEAETILRTLTSAETLPNLATGLIEAVNDGHLPLRQFRLLNERLTTGFNTMLADNLSIDDLFIENFVDDVEGCLAIVENEESPELVEIIHNRTPEFLGRWFCIEYAPDMLAGEDQPREYLCLIDEAINLQVAFTLDDLVTLRVGDDPVLVKASTHPRLAKLFRDQLKRHKGTTSSAVRVITADGVYLEIMFGWAVENAVLVKRLPN